MRLLFAIPLFFFGWHLFAAGIIPDRINQIMIYSKFKDEKPAFYLIFSEKALPEKIDKKTMERMVNDKTDAKTLVLKVHSKEVENKKRISYFFGTSYDEDKSWNDGREFSWKDWEKYSPDIWDNIGVAYISPTKKGRFYISDIVIRKGGIKLLDTRGSQSYPNKKKIKICVPKVNISSNKNYYTVLNLGETMDLFRKKYYELDSKVLEKAYADLGQTDKNKYARRGTAWCSEFASFILRSEGINTPDPNKDDVYWDNLREFYEKNGKVYPLSEVAKWSDKKKLNTINPGSLVSFLTHEGQDTHTAIFTTWVKDKKGIDKYTAISGCNKGMVWAHDSLLLPNNQTFVNMTKDELKEFDKKCFFGVINR